MSALAHRLGGLGRRALPLPLWLAKLALVGLIVWPVAALVWRAFEPRLTVPAVTPSRNPLTLAGDIAARQIFGTGADGAASAPSAALPALVLKGVLAGKLKQRSAAIVVVGGQAPALVREGEELAPGAKLDRVYSDRIEILVGGGRQTVALTR